MSQSDTPNSESRASAYARAGVNLAAADETVARLGALVEGTRIPGVLRGIGGFGSLFSLRDAGVLDGPESDPVLVSGTDGVGTKLQLAFALDRHDTIGIDCVAMCVNDVITSGARPLFFLDYFATGQLEPAQAEAVVRGIARGCALSGCALVGGETAEMPGFYAPGEYDLAGFCVGVVDRQKLLVPERVRAGDLVVGVASSGVHSNGFSLVRKIIADRQLDLTAPFSSYQPQETADSNPDARTLGEVLLEPTQLYAAWARDLLQTVDVHGLAHITGGGFDENLPRVLPHGHGATIDTRAWPRPPIFDFLQTQGQVAPQQMYQIFNMGIGMMAIIPPEALTETLAVTTNAGLNAWPIGEVTLEEGVTLKGLL